MTKNLIDEITTLVQTGTAKHQLPFKVGNAIRIGPVIIRPKKKTNTYFLLDSKDQKIIGEVYSKHAALAIAKLYNENKKINFAVALDQKIQKHEIDVMFYEHTFEKTTSEARKDVLNTRITVSKQQLDNSIARLEQIIFS